MHVEHGLNSSSFYGNGSQHQCQARAGVRLPTSDRSLNMRRSPPRQARLMVERLEDRLVPAGNVLVALQGDQLVVTGDALSNGLEVSPGTVGGQVVFRGLDGTRINGMSDVFVQTVPGGIDNFNIALGEGDDVLVLTNRSEADPHWPLSSSPAGIRTLTVQQDLTIVGDKGADVIQLRNVIVQGNLDIRTHQGGDVVVVEGVNAAAGVSVDSGSGADALLIRGSTITGATSIGTRNGRDAVGLIGSDFAGDVVVRLHGSVDSVSVEGNAFMADLDLDGGQGGGSTGGTGSRGAVAAVVAPVVNQMTEDIEGANDITGAFQHTRLADTLERVSQTHFTYEGEEGPEHWGRLTPAFLLSEVGRQQTPIAITTATLVEADLPDLGFNYQDNTNLTFFHNGHTIQVAGDNRGPFPAGSTLDVLGETYNLLQFHFHTGSEHTVDGHAFPLEMHLVHSNAAGDLLVIGVFIEEGAANAAYDALINHLPEHDGPNEIITESFNPESLLPDNLDSYYAYTGSLTTPPASQGVSFGIFTEPVELSAEQIHAIEESLHEHNARPVQPTNDRVVFVSARASG